MSVLTARAATADRLPVSAAQDVVGLADPLDGREEAAAYVRQARGLNHCLGRCAVVVRFRRSAASAPRMELREAVDQKMDRALCAAHAQRGDEPIPGR